MKIYTKTGDAGHTGLFSGRRVPKNHPLVSAYGTVDELNSHLGVVLACQPTPIVSQKVKELQIQLFKVGADLATELQKKSVSRISEEDVASLENQIDQIAANLPNPRAFILPGGSLAAAHLQVARTVCRRAERDAISAGDINPLVRIWLNRLSDLLFLLARLDNHESQIPEPLWHPQGSHEG